MEGVVVCGLVSSFFAASPAQLSPTHGIDQLNKVLVAFGIKLIKAWGIRGSLQVRGETEVHETKCQCIALLAVKMPGVAFVGTEAGAPGACGGRRNCLCCCALQATAKAYVESACARIGFRLKNSPIPIKLLLVECELAAVRSILNKIC